MSVLLLVRSADDVPSAAKAASEYLAYRRQHTAAPPEANEVLGIWLRRELEAGLLTWPCSDHESGADARAGSSTGKMASEPAP